MELHSLVGGYKFSEEHTASIVIVKDADSIFLWKGGNHCQTVRWRNPDDSDVVIRPLELAQDETITTEGLKWEYLHDYVYFLQWNT